jgi:hypothetical protein
MTIEMINLPVFGEGAGVPFPRFGLKPKASGATEKICEIRRGKGSCDTQ